MSERGTSNFPWIIYSVSEDRKAKDAGRALTFWMDVRGINSVQEFRESEDNKIFAVMRFEKVFSAFSFL